MISWGSVFVCVGLGCPQADHSTSESCDCKGSLTFVHQAGSKALLCRALRRVGSTSAVLNHLLFTIQYHKRSFFCHLLSSQSQTQKKQFEILLFERRSNHTNNP